VGETVGWRVGALDVGWGEGSRVGTAVGVAAGWRVGGVVGAADGASVGEALGLAVGARDVGARVVKPGQTPHVRGHTLTTDDGPHPMPSATAAHPLGSSSLHTGTVDGDGVVGCAVGVPLGAVVGALVGADEHALQWAGHVRATASTQPAASTIPWHPCGSLPKGHVGVGRAVVGDLDGIVGDAVGDDDDGPSVGACVGLLEGRAEGAAVDGAEVVVHAEHIAGQTNDMVALHGSSRARTAHPAWSAIPLHKSGAGVGIPVTGPTPDPLPESSSSLISETVGPDVDGTLVGGKLVGMPVGDADAVAVGAPEGIAVGADDGVAVGRLVVGAAVS
jgi:hypothetical protein